MPSIVPDPAADSVADPVALARARAREQGIGAPSPVEAWAPPDEAPPFNRYPVRFLRWVAARHRETVDDNPIYRKSAGRRYVRRPDRLSPLTREILTAIVFAAVVMVVTHALRHFTGQPRASLPWRYFLPVIGAVFLVSLLVAGFSMAHRASRFIKTTDNAMVWDDLILTPLREDHFLWGWIWSPLIERTRGILLAVVFGVFGVWFSPFRDHLTPSPSFPVPVSLSLLALALLFMGVLALALALGLATLGIIQSLDLGPRLYDAAGALWGLFHLLPLGTGFAMECVAGGFLIAGANDDPQWFVSSLFFSLAGMPLVAWGDWLAIQYLLPGFWDALLARRTVRGQKSWWRALLGK